MKKFFGTTKNNEEVSVYTIKKGDLEAEVITYGGIIKNLYYKGRDIVLGYDTLKEYEDGIFYFGAIVGRCANVTGGASFKIDGTEYKISRNSGEHHSHGGFLGFDRKIWNVSEYSENKITLNYLSVDGEEGYPGNLNILVTYEIEDNSLIITYRGETDKDTVCNITNHSYFNLNGHNSGDILKHRLKINSSRVTSFDSKFISLGEIDEVAGTYFDFTNEKEIGRDIFADDVVLEKCGGFDMNYCVDDELCAVLLGNDITMEVYTDKPGVQLYTSNYVDTKGKNGCYYGKQSAVCLETQFYPNAINNDNFPSPILRSGEIYLFKTIYKFI